MIQRTLGVGLMLMLLIGGNWGNVPMGQAQAGTETIHLAGETATLPDVQVQLTSEPINNPGTDLQTENLYQGPVTFSVIFGQSVDAYNEINGLGPVKDFLPVERNGITQSATRSNFHNIRLFIHLEWPGMDQADSHIRDLARKGRVAHVSLVGVAFKMFLEAGDGYFGEISNFPFDTIHGGWIQGGLPDGAQQIWIQPVRKVDENVTSEPPIEGKWRVNLYDVTPKKGRMLSDICQSTECLSIDIIHSLNGQGSLIPSISPIPVFCPGQVADGITIRQAWFGNQPLWQDESRANGFVLFNWQIPGQQKIFIEIASIPPKRSFLLIFKDKGGAYKTSSLDNEVLFGQASGPVALDSYPGGIRAVNKGIVLIGTIPQNTSLAQIYLVQEGIGPVWRLECGSK